MGLRQWFSKQRTARKKSGDLRNRQYGNRLPWLVAIVIFFAGIVFLVSLNWAIEATNTESFCISCHEMRDNVYREYQESIHYRNGSGVRATCPDCHVPKPWFDKVLRKIKASNELYHAIIGTINTRDRFLSKRQIMAEHVWSEMQANDSLECRNCHELTSMDNTRQSAQASSTHQKAQQQQMTCIDCHKGIAHRLPESYLDQEHERFEKENINCSHCHENLHKADDWGDDDW